MRTSETTSTRPVTTSELCAQWRRYRTTGQRNPDYRYAAEVLCAELEAVIVARGGAVIAAETEPGMWCPSEVVPYAPYAIAAYAGMPSYIVSYKPSAAR